METLSLSNIKKVIEDFESKYPRKEIPSFCYANKNTIKRLREYFKPIIKYGYIDFSGIPIYDKAKLDDGEIEMYNVDKELMHTFIIE